MKIAVLMSTYNGEKYVKDQIDSILEQKLLDDWELTLYIRDDGSSDQTINIIKEYVKLYKNVVLLNEDVTKNLGAGKNFFNLLKMVYELDDEISYFAFADQDDIWMDDKLICAIKKLKESINEKGALYYSNKIIVDKDLRKIGEEHIIYYGDFLEILGFNFAFGCTMAFDSNLVKYAVRYFPHTESYHDAWVYKVAKCIGSDILFDENPYIYYRQHGDNAVGIESAKIHNKAGYMILHIFASLTARRKHIRQKIIKEIADNYSDVIDPAIESYIDAIIHYTDSFKKKMFLIRMPELKKRSPLTHLVWIYRFLFNKV